jgi:ATP-dependent Clp protease ATP-binding subunit ClpC
METQISMTPRMQTALLTAQENARDLGHNHIGCEHVILAILVDRHSLPAQILEESGAIDGVVQ